jgi:hypothetical protein
VISDNFSFSPLTDADVAPHVRSGLHWIEKSIQATGGKGSAHHYMPVLGWSKAYPETTGYLIETLLNYSDVLQEEKWRHLALECTNWLCDIQLDTGAFNRGMAGETAPSVFNTSQILFGLCRCLETELPSEHEKRWLQAAVRATNWLLDNIEPDGSWTAAAYVPDYIPSYYTRAVMGLLYAGRVLSSFSAFTRQQELEEQCHKALHFYAQRFLPNDAVQHWGFKPGESGFTHTIAYTLEGFWHSALHLNENFILNKTIRSVSRFMQQWQRDGKIAGSYDENWKGDTSFTCPVGTAQMCVLVHDIHEYTGDPALYMAQFILLKELLPHQKSDGAVPGSVPLTGPYMRGKYPNWAVKFFLDALLPLQKRAFDQGPADPG